MASVEPGLAAARLRMALDMHEEGVRLMRQNLRRRNPGASGPEIERMLGDWLQQRPGAKHGDAEGISRRPGRWQAD